MSHVIIVIVRISQPDDAKVLIQNETRLRQTFWMILQVQRIQNLTLVLFHMSILIQMDYRLDFQCPIRPLIRS